MVDAILLRCSPAVVRLSGSAVQVPKPEILNQEFKKRGKYRGGWPSGGVGFQGFLARVRPIHAVSFRLVTQGLGCRPKAPRSKAGRVPLPKKSLETVSFTVFLDLPQVPLRTGSRQPWPDPSQVPDRHSRFVGRHGGSIHHGIWQRRPWESSVVMDMDSRQKAWENRECCDTHLCH